MDFFAIQDVHVCTSTALHCVSCHSPHSVNVHVTCHSVHMHATCHLHAGYSLSITCHILSSYVHLMSHSFYSFNLMDPLPNTFLPALSKYTFCLCSLAECTGQTSSLCTSSAKNRFEAIGKFR